MLAGMNAARAAGALEHCALGLDLGTSSAKAVVTDTGGKVLAQASAGYAVTSAVSGYAESEPAHWWSAVTACAREAVAAAVRAAGTRPAAIGLSGQMHGLVLASADGQALRPALLWADSRATGALRAYRRLGPAALARLANPLAPGMTGPLLMWVAEHEPGTYRDARWALAPKDWLRARLTGEIHAEPSDASASLLYDVPGDRWDLEVVSALGLDASLLAPAAALGRSAGRSPDRLGRGRAGAARGHPGRGRGRRHGGGGPRQRHRPGRGPADRRHRRAGHPAAGRAGQPGGRRGQPVPVGDAGRLVPDGRHSQRRAQPQLGARGHERQLGGAVRQRRSPGPGRRPDLRPAPVGGTDAVFRSGAARLLDRAVAGRRPGVAAAVRARGNRVRDPRRPGRPAGDCRGSARRGCGWPAAAPWPRAGGSCSRTCWGCRCTPWTCPRRPAGARPCWEPTRPAC